MAGAATGGAGGWVAVDAAVAAAQVARSGVGGFQREDRHHRAVDVAVHHRHHVVLDAVAVAAALATHDHLEAHRIGVAGGEGVGAVGLLKGAAHPVDAHLPELGGHGLGDLGVVDPLDAGLEVGAHHEAAFLPPVALLPDAAPFVTAETGFPGVAVLVGGAEQGGDVGAGSHDRAGGSGGGQRFRAGLFTVAISGQTGRGCPAERPR